MERLPSTHVPSSSNVSASVACPRNEAWLCASSRLVWEALSALSGASRYAVYTSVCSGCSPWKASQSIRGFKRPSNVRPVRLPSTDSRHRTGPRT